VFAGPPVVKAAAPTIARVVEAFFSRRAPYCNASAELRSAAMKTVHVRPEQRAKICITGVQSCACRECHVPTGRAVIEVTPHGAISIRGRRFSCNILCSRRRTCRASSSGGVFGLTGR
jgi:hypothetical protein